MPKHRFSPKEFRFTVKSQFCVYCGEWASCMDHFPPYSASLSGFLLPACKECNAIAGTEYPFDFKARAKFIQERLRVRYRALLDTPEWSSTEMRPLGYTLKQMVKSWSERRKIAARRTEWNAQSYLAMLPSAKEFLHVTFRIELAPEKQGQAFKRQFLSLIETEAA